MQSFHIPESENEKSEEQYVFYNPDFDYEIPTDDRTQSVEDLDSENRDTMDNDRRYFGNI